MDRNHHSSSISRSELYAKIGTPSAPIVVDVRPDADVEASDRLVVSASLQSPDRVELWARELPRDRLIVLYCVDGREVSQTAAATLRALGLNAVYLERGFEDWVRIGLPTRRNVGAVSGKWVTRERPKIDRIACPWLISRFIDPSAQFLYVPTALVIATASQLNATPYDIEGVEFAHEGERCSFDTIIRIYDIRDKPLHQLASIVRGADTSRHDLAPQCGGLFAISLGLSANFANDHEMLAQGMVMYDALYTWCRSLQHETHNWPAKAPVNQSAAFQN
jgi:rhodanese-related sulfurtransferase